MWTTCSHRRVNTIILFKRVAFRFVEQPSPVIRVGMTSAFIPNEILDKSIDFNVANLKYGDGFVPIMGCFLTLFPNLGYLEALYLLKGFHSDEYFPLGDLELSFALIAVCQNPCL